MTSKINKILTNQQQEFSPKELANVSASLSAILGQGGGGGGEPCASAWLPSVDENGNLSWTLTTSTTAPGSANIMGPQGPSGTSGAKGEDGTSIILQSVTDVAGGKQVTLAWGETPSTSSFVIPSGANGTDGQDGENGTSVIVKSIREFNDTVGSHTKGGTEVTLEWTEDDTVKTSAFSAFNGEKGQDGAGASYTFDSVTMSGDGDTDPLGVDTNVIATQAWVGERGYLTAVPDTYATKTYANDASANALSEAKTWVGDQGFLKAVPAEYATKTYANDASAYALSQAETYADSTSAEALSQAKSWTNLQNFATSAGLDDNKQYAMTKTGWSDFTIPSTSGYLPLSGGTVSGQLIVSATSANFDSQFLKFVREGNDGHGRIGLGAGGPLALKVDDANNHTTQVNISPNATNDKLVQVQHGTTTAYLIPAVTANTTANLTDDGMLHIIVEN